MIWSVAFLVSLPWAQFALFGRIDMIFGVFHGWPGSKVESEANGYLYDGV